MQNNSSNYWFQFAKFMAVVFGILVFFSVINTIFLPGEIWKWVLGVLCLFIVIVVGLFRMWRNQAQI